MRKKLLTGLLAVSLFTASFTACAGKGDGGPINTKNTEQTAEESQPQDEEDSQPQGETDSQQAEEESQLSFETGLSYYYGTEGTKDDTQALECFQAAADAGNADVYYYIGNINEDRYDFDAEVENFKTGDANGSALCSYALGDCYYEGLIVGYDFGKAREYYEKAINAGLVEANYGLGKLAANGNGEDVDVNKAVTCFEKAIQGSDPGIVADAYSWLASIYSNASYGLEVDYDKAIEYYTKANDLTQGCTGSYMRSIALCYQKLGDTDSEKEWNKKALDKFKALAEGGDPYAMYKYASYCEDGIGLDEPDYVTAWEWYNKAFEAGYAGAAAEIGNIYKNKNYAFYDAVGIDDSIESDATASFWYQEGANALSTNCMYYLADLYRAGRGIDRDVEKAIEYYEQAAYYGEPSGYIQIGRTYLYGVKDAVEADVNKAIEYFAKAADAGLSSGYDWLGSVYKNESYGVLDYAKTIEYLEKGASRRNTSCMEQLGGLYRDGKGVDADAETAISWYEKVVKAGDGEGYIDIAMMYGWGEGVPKDESKVLEYYRKAADEFNHGDAMEAIAHRYYQGKVVEQDYNEALKWYIKAGENGDSYGYEYAGNLYTNDYFGNDYAKANEFYEKAAYMGNSSSMYYLGRAYLIGEGTDVDYELAYKWLTRAKEKGCSEEDLDTLIMNARDLSQG